MTDDQPPPGALPPAAQSPYPAHQAPHPQRDEALAHPRQPPHPPEGPGVGALGITLIGGAVAAGIGLLMVLPLLRRKKPQPKPAPARRPGKRATSKER